MNKKVSLNYIYNLIYQIISVSLPILTVPYVSRILGPNELGKYYYVTSIVTYFGIIAVLGTVSFGQREIAKVQQDIKLRSKLFWEIYWFRAFFIFLSFIIYIVFTFFLYKKYISLFLANIFTFLAWLFDVSWYFQGVENFKVTAVRNSLVKIIITSLIFVLVKNPSDVFIYTFIYSVANMFGNLTMLPYLKQEIVFIKVSFKNIFSNTREILELFLPVVAIQLYSVLNKIMLGAMSNTIQVGFFSQIYTVVNLAITLIYAFVAVLTPRIAFLYNSGNSLKVKYYTRVAIGNVYMMGLPMMVGSLCVGNLFVPIFFGTSYIKAIPIMYVMSFLFVIIGMGQLLGSFLVAINRQRQYMIAVSITAVVNIILNYIVLKMGFEAIGVSLVTVISELLCTLIQCYYLRDLVETKDYFKYFLHYLSPSIIIIALSLILKVLIRSNAICLIFSVILSVAFYFIILYIKDDVLFKELISPFIKKFNK